MAGWPRNAGFPLAVFLVCLPPVFAQSPAEKPVAATIPGVVVDYAPSSGQRYIGSPSLAVLPDGSYLAAHDFFGPKSGEGTQGVTRVFASIDRGLTWQPRSEVAGAFWSTLFVHRRAVYLLGVDHDLRPTAARKLMARFDLKLDPDQNHVVIRRSIDGGRTWTQPIDENKGCLFAGNYDFSPTSVIERSGRLWCVLGMGMMTASVDADLLKASSWTIIPPPVANKNWLGGKFEGWGEGDAIVAPDGRIATLNDVRYLVPGDDRAALLFVDANGAKMDFDPGSGFVAMPGARIKFNVRLDPVSHLYWAFTNVQQPAYFDFRPDLCRNTVALISSPDLRNWTVRQIVLQHDHPEIYGFQYWAWDFDGDDVIALSRTAWPSPDGGPPRQHDANYLTFHRISHFRDSLHPEAEALPIQPLSLARGL